MYWTEKVHATLVAETEQIAEVGGMFSLSTNIKGLLDIPWIGSAANKMDLYMKVKKKLEKEQFIQLSHYQEYTNQIRKKCAAVVAAFQSNVKNTTTRVLDQLVAGNSSWMTIKPDAKCEAVAVAVNITAFVDELVTAFVRHYPPDQDFLTLHAGVPLGSERHEAREQLSKLNKDFDAVNDAVAEIKKAFDIDTEAEKSMVAKVEWD